MKTITEREVTQLAEQVDVLETALADMPTDHSDRFKMRCQVKLARLKLKDAIWQLAGQI